MCALLLLLTLRAHFNIHSHLFCIFFSFLVCLAHLQTMKMNYLKIHRNHSLPTAISHQTTSMATRIMISTRIEKETGKRKMKGMKPMPTKKLKKQRHAIVSSPVSSTPAVWLHHTFTFLCVFTLTHAVAPSIKYLAFVYTHTHIPHTHDNTNTLSEVARCKSF